MDDRCGVPDPVERAALVDRLYRPWHRRSSALVSDALEAAGTVPHHRLPLVRDGAPATEADQSPDRPDVCVGTDAHHTPPELAGTLEVALLEQGFSVRRDSPFSGAMVPADRYRTDLRVRSVMLEVRRGPLLRRGDRARSYLAGRRLPRVSSAPASLRHSSRAGLVTGVTRGPAPSGPILAAWPTPHLTRMS